MISENHGLKVMLEKNEDNRQRQKEEKARIVAAILNLYDHAKKMELQTKQNIHLSKQKTEKEEERPHEKKYHEIKDMQKNLMSKLEFIQEKIATLVQTNKVFREGPNLEQRMEPD